MAYFYHLFFTRMEARLSVRMSAACVDCKHQQRVRVYHFGWAADLGLNWSPLSRISNLTGI